MNIDINLKPSGFGFPCETAFSFKYKSVLWNLNFETITFNNNSTCTDSSNISIPKVVMSTIDNHCVKNKQTNNPTNKQTNKQPNKQTNKQPNKQISKQSVYKFYQQI